MGRPPVAVTETSGEPNRALRANWTHQVTG